MWANSARVFGDRANSSQSQARNFDDCRHSRVNSATAASSGSSASSSRTRRLTRSLLGAFIGGDGLGLWGAGIVRSALNRQRLPAVDVGVDLPFREPLVPQARQGPEQPPRDQPVDGRKRNAENKSSLGDRVGERFRAAVPTGRLSQR